jgi:cytoskeleton protein RodZ
MPSVGEILAAERRRQGKSLGQVVEGTKIRARLLDSLEQGRYDDLPPAAYVKGYIQSYARYLDIPVGPLLDQFRLEYKESEHGLSPADRYLASIPAETIVPERDRAHSIPMNVWVIAAVAGVIVLLIVCALARSLGGGASNSANTTPTTGAAGSSEVSQSPGASGTVDASQTVAVAPGSFKVTVSVRAGMASWVKATVDGRQAYAQTMLGGESRQWLATTSIVLTIGKPSAVVVTRDGQPVTVPAVDNARVDLRAAK